MKALIVFAVFAVMFWMGFQALDNLDISQVEAHYAQIEEVAR